MKRSKKNCHAFTLVELLVVIAIIAVLIAILLPVLSRARRAALVLASPVAYTGVEGAVHLTDPNGVADVGIKGKTAAVTCVVCHTPPVWSPLGQEVAYRSDLGISIVVPAPNRIRSFPENGRYFLCWSDSDHLVENDRSNICVATSGKNLLQDRVPHSTSASLPVVLSPTPAAAPQPYIGIILDNNGESVVFVKKNFTVGRRIYSATRSPEGVLSPRVDVSGEYVAWTQYRQNGVVRAAAFKHVREPSSAAPTLIGDPNVNTYFCDWTEKGDLLVNIAKPVATMGAASSNSILAIYDKRGRLIRELSTPTRPNSGVVASWRKYDHR